jgi:hypothetical protein
MSRQRDVRAEHVELVARDVLTTFPFLCPIDEAVTAGRPDGHYRASPQNIDELVASNRGDPRSDGSQLIPSSPFEVDSEQNLLHQVLDFVLGSAQASTAGAGYGS